MVKKHLLILTLFLICTSNAFAWTAYQYNLSPFDLRHRGSFYDQNNPYDHNNPNHIYSKYQNVYHPKAFRNNFKAYSAQVYTYYGQFQGHVSQQLHDPRAITNPYGPHGRVFIGIHPSRPYVLHKWNNPYSTFKRPYNPWSVYNNNQYSVHYNDGYRQHINSANLHTYNSQSITVPYGNSPYNNWHVANPYDNNKRFK